MKMCGWKVMEPLMAEFVDGAGGGGGDPIGDAITSSIAAEGGIEGAEPVSPAPVVTPPTPEEAAEEAELAQLEKDILAKNPTMANGKIAVHRHQAVLTRHRNQVEKERTEWKAKQAEYDKSVAEWKKYEWAKDPQLLENLQALDLAERDQKAFVEYLMQDQRFADLIEFKQKQQQAPVGGARPGPNAPDGNGGFYYDDKGLEALLAWERQQTVAESNKVLEAKQKEWENKFTPVQKEFEARNAWNKSLSEQKVVLEGMREKWPGFKEHEAAIKKAMKENEAWGVDEAYRAVVVPHLQNQAKADREKVRQELIAEMNGKKSAVVPVKPGTPERKAAEDQEVDLADIIRASIAQR